MERTTEEKKKILDEVEDNEDSEEEKNEEGKDDDNQNFVNTMIDDVISLYKTGRLSDVVFIVGKEREEIRAHKLVLASSSPIFEQMLFPNELHKNQMCFAAEAKFELPDVDVVSFKLLLQTIYTDKVEIDSKTLPNALVLSRRYCCEKLTLACTDFLEEGVNNDNVCNFFNHGEEIAGDPNFGLSFILNSPKKIFETSGFLELYKERLGVILGHNELNCREGYLLEKLIVWGQAKVEAEEEDADDMVLVKGHISDLLQYIRFPLMNLVEFNKVVGKSAILEKGDLLDLYCYISAKDAKVPPEKMPALNEKWNHNPRGSGGGQFRFKWIKHGNNSRIKDDGQTHFSQGSGYSCAIGDVGMAPETGSYYWEFKINQCGPSGWNCAAGVARQDVNLNNYLSSTAAGWGFFNQGCRAHASGSGSDYYGKKWGNPGELIGCHYDSDAGEVYFYINGENQGLAFKGITEEVWPASHVNTGVSITLNDDVETVLTEKE